MRDARAIAADSFCTTIKILAADLAKRLAGDALVDRAKSRIMLAANEAPITVTEMAGEHLFRYREQILAENEDFFFANTFEADLAAAKDAERRDLVAYIIPKAQVVARGLAPEERALYRGWVRDMLDSYVEYAIAKKEADAARGALTR